MSATTFKLSDSLSVGRLGFGAMRITGKGVWGHPSDVPSALALLRKVRELGITLIDTADAYGPEVSEYLIAEALHPYGDIVIATKGGLTRGGPNKWEADGRPAHLRRALENSLRRLKLERIPLYQLHVIDDQVPLEDSVGALAELQAQGKIEHIGLSNVTVAQLDRARKIVTVASVQNRYNLTYRKHEEVLAACEQAHIGFIPWYPLDTGALTREGLEDLTEVATRYEATTSQIALAWLLRRSHVMLPIPGTSSIAHLEENTKAREITLADDDFHLLDRLGHP